ncbi:MAG: D-alanyl-D-alanine carboxypeptidase [Clostridium sp.]|nr:D-alanyl-D-alanine carboxypeptidase [Clostridium sp.]
MNRKIKRITCFILAAAMSAAAGFSAFARPEWPADTGIMAESGIVMDKDSGAVIFGQNIHLPYAPASITKLLTALVVIENSKLDDMVTFSQSAVYDVESGSGNKLHMETGDQLSVEDCLYMLLLLSSNQAANALAEHVAGSRDAFVKMMNDRIAEIGCTESRFANPSGLNDDNQYVSAYDMALIAREAFDNEKLLEIDSAKSHSIAATANNPNGASFNMEHKLIMAEDPSSQFYCEGVMAGKTGFTSLAGNTLVTLAERNGKRLISVVLKGTQPQYYLDSKSLLEFGFANFDNVNIAENESAYTTGEEPVQVEGESYAPSDLYLDSAAVITVPKGAAFADAERNLVTQIPADHPKGAVALVEYQYNERKVGSAWLFSRSVLVEIERQEQMAQSGAAEPENPSETPASVQPQDTGKGFSMSLSAILFAVAAVVAVAAAVGLGLFIWREKKREREELARRRERRRQRLRESGVSEEEFERLRRERFGDR